VPEFIDAIHRFISGKKDAGKAKESEVIETSEKVKRLLKSINMDDVGIVVEQLGPYALVPFTDGAHRTKVFIVRDDDDTPADRAQISARIDELKFDPKYEKLNFDDVEPREFLAQIATNGMYVGFHDKMGFAIMRFTGLLDITDQPNSGKIDSVLRKAGFKNIGKDLN
jgi:hypothetical protein